jgi:2-C-methyl-D-erythritol 4-phosphate cytidylyltransferase
MTSAESRGDSGAAVATPPIGVPVIAPDPLPAATPRAAAPSRDVGVVIVAGGTGTRTASPTLKQFRWVAGKPMLLHSVQRFQARADVGMVVCVLPRAYAGDPPPWLFQADLDRLLISVGGRERQDSVANGLEDLPPEIAIVVVHDAARPLVTDGTIDAAIQMARTGQVAVAALPVVDTLKEVGDDGRVVRTVDRSRLWRVQTPQAFPRGLLERAHAAARRDHFVATDDAGLCERLGEPVVTVRGSERALKITEESDFARADALAVLTE